MALNDTSQITSAMSEFYTRVILDHGEVELAHDRYGQQRPIPKRSSKVIKYSRYGLFASAASTPSGAISDVETNSVPLSEGVPPTGKFAARAEITATLEQYADFVEYTDMVDLTNPDPVLTELSQLLGEQSLRSLDIVHRDQLVTGTNKFFSNGTVETAVNTVVNATVLEAVLRDLHNEAARMFTQILRATTGVGTQPIRAAYWAIVHPDVYMPTLDNLAGFISLEKYAQQGPQQPGEVGAFKNIRFVMSQNAKVKLGVGATGGTSVKETATKADVYVTLVFGKDAYGISPLAGNGLRSITKAIGSAGTADPVDQKGTIGWKAITAPAKILNDNNLAVVHTAASA